ncbi:pteridine reductase [Saccharicrinis carchari]|uniref:Pteridine reductase n=1 Tax=Saccharicrinis carchari TaxID=1168039 RepID=A0A521BWH3_SACCC|nr:SDR family oxidoreductase [Saccharicrinis carchari]SMO51557.1 pteridine reductase [Saccharicrinis carchari]
MEKYVLVTGAAKRIGSVISQQLAAEGWSVLIHYNSSDKDALKLAAQLKEAYPRQEFPTMQCDLSSTKEVLNLFQNTPVKNMKLRALINNASIFTPGSITDITPDFLAEQMGVNFEAPLFLMQTFKKHFGQGSIINMLDTNVIKNIETHAAYLLAKKSLDAITKMAALAWAPAIRVNGIAPGPVLPPPNQDQKHLEKVIANTPLKRQVGTDDIVQTVSFLLNNPSITGQIIFCDSGAHLK